MRSEIIVRHTSNRLTNPKQLSNTQSSLTRSTIIVDDIKNDTIYRIEMEGSVAKRWHLL